MGLEFGKTKSSKISTIFFEEKNREESKNLILWLLWNSVLPLFKSYFETIKNAVNR
jgi:hypothetical protein